MRRCRTRQPTFLIRCARFSVTTGAALIASATAIGQTKKDPLDSPDGLRLHDVTAEPVDNLTGQPLPGTKEMR
jgi:hypothetical protein